MKTHTTNYFNSFIAIADGCPTAKGEVPPQKGDTKTAANIQFDLISKHPYKYTSDDVLFQVYADKNGLTKSEHKDARAVYFSKGQPCMRTSALTKRYGWGIHYNSEGKIALYPADSAEYKNFMKDETLKIIKAMKSSK
jgi:hypothetical protein